MDKPTQKALVASSLTLLFLVTIVAVSLLFERLFESSKEAALAAWCCFMALFLCGCIFFAVREIER